MSKWTRKRGIGKTRSSADMVAKRYTLPASAVRELKKAGLDYGSQGKALLAATEILIRMEDPPPPDPQPSESTQATFRLHVRTVDIIQTLARTRYNNDRGQVFAACVKVLKMKRIRI